MQREDQNYQSTNIEPEAQVAIEPPVYTAPSEPAPLPEHHFTAPPKKSKRKLIVALLCIATLVVVSGGVYLYTNKQEKPVAKQEVKETKQASTPEIKQEEIDAALAKFIKPTTGETWLAQPKKLPSQGFYKIAAEDANVQYFEVGKRGENTILLVAGPGPSIGDYISLVERSKSGQLTIVNHPDSDAVYNNDGEANVYADFLKPGIAINNDIHYDSVTLPRQLDLDKGYKLSKPSYTTVGDLPVQPSAEYSPKITEIKKLGGSAIYRNEVTDTTTNLTSISYYLRTPFNTEIPLGYEPLELSTDNYQWQSGFSGGDKFKAITRGCGGRVSAVTRGSSIKDSDLQFAGKSPSGLEVYELKDQNNILLQKAYDEFKEFNSTVSPNDPNANVSKADFIKQHALVMHKDKFGQWLVFVRENFAPGYGCAKPVIYLYPSSTTKVSVRVGADVKISDPQYDTKQGWKDVLARPSGALTYQGKVYDSLFWEGPGVGKYPSISSGIVVPTNQALRTINTQLKQLGLNNKEIADFQAYWQDKLPAKPYTRLTWLTTNEMNQLAPLYITPKPDTIIRVFLDYSGLDAPIAITPQSLTKIPRSGFTVVEWGGLSPKRLY